MAATLECGPIKTGSPSPSVDDIAVSSQQESSHAIGTSLAVTSQERDLNCPLPSVRSAIGKKLRGNF
ncbi:MAG: hypothetical protein F6J93_39310 [Oscillatoria sp. SIO1A7]|nr:hypothetical protein [Oscillatoria sp. SIO1A7]